MYLCYRRNLEEERVRFEEVADKKISMVTAAILKSEKRKYETAQTESTVSLAVFKAEQVSNGGEELTVIDLGYQSDMADVMRPFNNLDHLNSRLCVWAVTVYQNLLCENFSNQKCYKIFAIWHCLLMYFNLYPIQLHQK